MCSQSPNDDQNCPVDRADSAQLVQRNHVDENDGDESISLAESAQSITDSDLQTKQHNNHQAIQHNINSAVVDIEREEKKFILIELGKLGISSPIAVQLVEKHGQQ
jgi:hypothetical protein